MAQSIDWAIKRAGGGSTFQNKIIYCFTSINGQELSMRTNKTWNSM